MVCFSIGLSYVPTSQILRFKDHLLKIEVMKKEKRDQISINKLTMQEVFENMKEEELFCEICGQVKPKMELWLSWRNTDFFQSYPSIVCKDEKNCHPYGEDSEK